MKLDIDFKREEDGRWIAIIDHLNVLAYGNSQEQAAINAKRVALEAIVFMLEGGHIQDINQISFHSLLAVA